MKSKKIKKILAIAIASTMVSTIAPVSASAAWLKDSQNNWNWTENGDKATGWKQVDETWYHFDSSGKMQTGWVKSDSKWYYMNTDGAMKIGWLKDTDGKWYNLAPSGEMKTGWLKDTDGKWYFTDASGAMQTGVVEVQGKVYVLDNSGAMAVGTTEVNGQTYTIDASGAITGDKLPTPNKAFTSQGTSSTVDVVQGGTATTTTTDSSSSSSSRRSSHNSSSSNSTNNSNSTPTVPTTSDTTINESNVVSNYTGNGGNVDITLPSYSGTITLGGNINKLNINAPNATIRLENANVSNVNLADVANHSIYVVGTTYIQILVVNDANNDAHIVVDGNASIANTTVLSGALLEVSPGATNANPFDNVTIAPTSILPPSNPVKLSGQFNNVVVEKTTSVEVDGTIGTVLVNQAATGAQISIALTATVATLNTNAQIAVGGTGNIGTANLGISGTTINIPAVNITHIAVMLGVTATVSDLPVSEGAGATAINSIPTNLTPVLDKTALTTVLTTASAVKAGVQISTDGSDVSTTSKWVKQSVSNALDVALIRARNAGVLATQESDITSAASALNSAVATYNAAKIAGSVDKHGLQPDISDAYAKYTSAEEGTLAGQYAVGSKATILTAINAAKAVMDKVNATQTEVNNEITTLGEALTAFENSKVAAENEAQVNININDSSLGDVIVKATDNYDSTKQDEYGVIVKSGDKVKPGSNLWISAKPKEGYRFKDVTVTNGQEQNNRIDWMLSSGGKIYEEVNSNNIEIAVNFEEIPDYLPKLDHLSVYKDNDDNSLESGAEISRGLGIYGYFETGRGIGYCTYEWAVADDEIGTNKNVINELGSSDYCDNIGQYVKPGKYLMVTATPREEYGIGSPITKVFKAVERPTLSSYILTQNDTTTSSAVNLTWNKATDNITPQNQLKYSLYMIEDKCYDTINEWENNATLLTQDNDIDSFQVTGLKDTSDYYFQLIVEDADGNKTKYTTEHRPSATVAEKTFAFSSDPSEAISQFQLQVDGVDKTTANNTTELSKDADTYTLYITPVANKALLDFDVTGLSGWGVGYAGESGRTCDEFGFRMMSVTSDNPSVKFHYVNSPNMEHTTITSTPGEPGSKSVNVTIEAKDISDNIINGINADNVTLTLIDDDGNNVWLPLGNYKNTTNNIYGVKVSNFDTNETDNKLSFTLKFTADNLSSASQNKFTKITDGSSVNFKASVLRVLSGNLTAKVAETKVVTGVDEEFPSNAKLDSTHKIITFTFNKNIINNTVDMTELKKAITISLVPGVETYDALGANDTVEISGNVLKIIFDKELPVGDNWIFIDIKGNALKDEAGNIWGDGERTGDLNPNDSVYRSLYITVDKTRAIPDESNSRTYNVVLPNGTDLTKLIASDVVAIVQDTSIGSTVGTPTTNDNGKTWTVDVTVAGGPTIKYTINVTVGVVKAALTEAISLATQEATTATLGTDVGNYAKADLDNFNTAIASAQSVADNTNATQNEVEDAVSALATAKATFKGTAVKATVASTYATTNSLTNTTVSVANGTDETDAIQTLDKTVSVVGSNGEAGTATINWTIADYNGVTAGDYTATGTLALPAGWAGTAANVTATVIVK